MLDQSAANSIDQQASASPKLVLFARGVIARLAIWPALRIAVEQGWGGPDSAQKRTWLASVIVDAFEHEDPVPDTAYIEETLLQVMSDEFETILEDFSAESVAKDVILLWDEVNRGQQQLTLRFEEQAEKLRGKKTNVQEQIVNDGEWEDEDEDGNGEEDDGEDEEEVPQLVDHSEPQVRFREEPQMDEDGFTMVKGKGKGRR